MESILNYLSFQRTNLKGQVNETILLTVNCLLILKCIQFNYVVVLQCVVKNHQITHCL